MPETIVIRRMQAADLGDYKALRDGMLAAHADAFTSDAATESGRKASSYLPRLGLDRHDGGHFTLGAWSGERLCGVLSCERDPRLKVRHIGHLAGMMVAPEVRGAGIGRLLLQACLNEARQASGLELLTLSVTAGNLPAERLYAQAGFVRYGSLPHAIKLGDTYHDKHLMMLAL